MQETADTLISYGWLSLAPSLLAIGAALLTRQVYLSLFLGLVVGAWIVIGGGIETLPQGIASAFDQYILRTLVPEDGHSDHISILLFTLTTGGMVGIIAANGGMSGVVRHLMRFAHTRQRGQGAATGLGLLIFFDDYANTMIVGNTMRPLADHLKISREKLAFIVDATAAPVASIAMVSAWFAFQASLINESLPEAYRYVSGFDLLVAAVGYNFYPLLMIAFLVLMIITGRDFGPMLRAEQRALSLHKPDHFKEEKGELHTHAASGVLPILAMIGVTLLGFALTGEGDTLRDVMSTADPFRALLWGALAGLLVALLMTLLTRTLTLAEAMEAMEQGVHPMVTACIILTLSWAIADVNAELRTADFIVSALGADVSAHWLPLLIFLLAGIIAFATGTGWGTMGLLIPVSIPLAVAILQQGSLEDPASHPLMLATVAAVVSGAVFGRHCSPISDTTVLSSLASGCTHINHVVTQLPYALLVAGVAAVAGIVPVSFGVPWWGALILGVVMLYGALHFIGKRGKVD